MGSAGGVRYVVGIYDKTARRKTHSSYAFIQMRIAYFPMRSTTPPGKLACNVKNNTIKICTDVLKAIFITLLNSNLQQPGYANYGS